VDLLRWDLVERVADRKVRRTDCKVMVSDYVFGYRRSSKMAEEKYEHEKLGQWS
jgi:hypothetical protein